MPIPPEEHMAGVEGFEPSPCCFGGSYAIVTPNSYKTSRLNRITFVRRLPYPFG